MANFRVTATLSGQMRDAAGRFERLDAASLLDRELIAAGTAAAQSLQDATPVRTGRAKAAWRATFAPSDHTVHVSNETPYLWFLIRGTGRMKANPTLTSAVDALPDMLKPYLGQAGRRLLEHLRGQG